MLNLKLRLTVVLLATLAFAGAKAQNTTCSNNLLLLNKLIVGATNLSIQSRGMLEMVQGNPYDPKAVRVPIKAYLKRAGKMLDIKALESQQNEGIEVSRLLIYAKDGDELIIETNSSNTKKEVRSFNLKSMNFLAFMNKEGC